MPPSRLVLTRLGLLTAGFGALVFVAPSAQAQALPPVGADVRVGDLRQQFSQILGQTPADPDERAWTFQPAIGVSESYDDGVPTRNGRHSADFITQLSPSLLITGESQRLSGTLSYAPTVNLYVKNGSENYVAQNLNAAGTITFVPDLLFMDLRGYVSEQSLGGQGNNFSTNGSNNQVQSSNFSAKPYLQHTFGDIGTVDLDYTLSHSTIDSGDSAFNTSTTSSTEHANFTTGDILGRFNESVDGLAIDYNGNGALSGAYRRVFNNQLSYALNRELTLIGSIGYEHIVYPQLLKPYVVDDITWSGGFHYTPSPLTSVQLSYGHKEGGDSATLDSFYAPTARTTISARYSQSVGTDLESLQNSLGFTTVSRTGFLIDPNTGQPINGQGLITTTQFVPQTIPVYRTSTASLSAGLLEDRDTYTLTLSYQNQQVISGGQVQIGTTGQVGNAASNSGYSATVAWARDIAQGFSSNALVSYGVATQPFTVLPGATTNNDNGDQTNITLSVGISYALSATLTTSAQFTHTTTNGNTFGYAPNRNVITVSLQKTF